MLSFCFLIVCFHYSITDDAGNLTDGSVSENEGEFVPSSWDSLAQPSRSALKSPDKSSGVSRTYFSI